MKTTLKVTLIDAMNRWLQEQDSHDDRPSGIACRNCGEMMADAAASVYDASHAGSIAGAKDPESCGVEMEPA